ncbi:hypothetical protein BRC68_14240 [Halobacteriales archaeon QH_6_64_20]|nr:MAG: hypothetical protein BRC68_14240 [Halobacteriales archaeon QH_6_64_20]
MNDHGAVKVEAVELFEKVEFEMFEQRERFGRRELEELLYASLFSQGVSATGRSFSTLRSCV